MQNILYLKIEDIEQIGIRRKYLLNKVGVKTTRDLLLFFPIRFLQESFELKESDILIQVKVVKKYRLGKIFVVESEFKDKTVELHFFNIKSWRFFFNNNFYKIYGAFENNKKWTVKTPKVISSNISVMPVYESSISGVVLNKAINSVIEKLPFNSVVFNNMTLKEVLYNLHNNKNYTQSFECLKFLEASLFVFLFKNDASHDKIALHDDLLKILPHVMNNDQKCSFALIKKDLESSLPMKHLVFAEVGAGKTLIAFAAVLLMIQAGFNVVFLAPTITLAQQHAQWMIPLLEKHGYNAVLFVSSTKKKKKVSAKITEGAYNLIIGTHALLHKEDFSNLGLVIIDEMQRFGILQRANLLEKCVRKNLLMLSATPIPRSLNITLSKFMNCSKISNSVYKKRITTTMHNMNNIDLFVQKLASAKKKAYWVVSCVEDYEGKIGVNSRFEYIKENADVEVLQLHGKMKDVQKLDVIQQFRDLDNVILVATTVIEIGIDVPDADIILIENAGLFGLSQLHQLRGRVGRKGQEAFCLLLNDGFSKKLNYLKKYSHGFDIAQIDMELRGEGAWIGPKQHGFDSFHCLKMPEDEYILDLAKEQDKVFDEFDIFIKSFEMNH